MFFSAHFLPFSLTHSVSFFSDFIIIMMNRKKSTFNHHIFSVFGVYFLPKKNLITFLIVLIGFFSFGLFYLSPSLCNFSPSKIWFTWRKRRKTRCKKTGNWKKYALSLDIEPHHILFFLSFSSAYLSYRFIFNTPLNSPRPRV